MLMRRSPIASSKRPVDASSIWRRETDVVLTISSAGGPTDQLRWAARCDWFQRLLHPSLARLLDYGSIGESRRFEAWRCCGSAVRRPSKEASRTACRCGRAFLRACGLTASENGEAMSVGAPPSATRQRRAWSSIPGAATGYPCDGGRSRQTRAFPLDNCGILASSARGLGRGGVVRSPRRRHLASPRSCASGDRRLRQRRPRCSNWRGPRGSTASCRSARRLLGSPLATCARRPRRCS